VTISFSCKTIKESPEENNEIMTDEMVEEETTVPDMMPDLDQFAMIEDCLTDWSKKERQILKRDIDYINRMYDAADGVISVITKVNRDGYVFYTNIQDLKTTVTDKKILNMARDIVEGYEFEPSDTAPKHDCGLVVFNLTTM